jgi:hypothetical protein
MNVNPLFVSWGVSPALKKKTYTHLDTSKRTVHLEEGQVDRCISVDNKETRRSFVKLSVERYISILFTRLTHPPSSHSSTDDDDYQARRKLGDIFSGTSIHTGHSVIDDTKNIDSSQTVSVCESNVSPKIASEIYQIFIIETRETLCITIIFQSVKITVSDLNMHE